MTLTATWPARLPKVELHLHREGAIALPALWQIMQNGIAASFLTAPEKVRLRKLFLSDPAWNQ